MSNLNTQQASKKSFIETKGIERIRSEEATGKPRNVFWLWIAANTEFATLATGALMTGIFGLSVPMAILAISLGSIAGSLLLAKASTFGVETGLPQMTQGVSLFGKAGNRFPAFFNFFSGFSWFAVNTSVGAYALYSLFHLPLFIGVILLSVVQISIAMIGHDFIHTTERYLMFILIAVFVILTGFTLVHFAGSFAGANPVDLKENGGFSGAFIVCTSIALSYMLGWVPYSSDYTRYMSHSKNPKKTKRAVFWYAFLGSALPNIWIQGIGAVIGGAIVLSTPDQLIAAWIPHWFVYPLIFAVILGVISANILTIYSATLSALAVGFRFKQSTAALITGGLGLIISLLAITGFFRNYESFLLLLGYWAMPWVVILLLDHALPGRTARVKGLNPAFTAWLIALLSSIVFMNQELYVGIFPTYFPNFGDITFGVGAVLAAAFYLLLSKKDDTAKKAA